MRRRILLLKKIREQGRVKVVVPRVEAGQTRTVQPTPSIETGEMTFGYEEEF